MDRIRSKPTRQHPLRGAMMYEYRRAARAGKAHDLNVIGEHLKTRSYLVADAREEMHSTLASSSTVPALRILKSLHQERAPPDLIIAVDDRVCADLRPREVVRQACKQRFSF